MALVGVGNNLNFSKGGLDILPVRSTAKKQTICQRNKLIFYLRYINKKVVLINSVFISILQYNMRMFTLTDFNIPQQ